MLTEKKCDVNIKQMALTAKALNLFKTNYFLLKLHFNVVLLIIWNIL